MAKFNKSGAVLDRPDTKNRAGGDAYTLSAKNELASVLLTSFLNDKYYQSGQDGMKQIVDLLDRVDPLFAAKAAVYARKEFGMRSVSHLVAAELAGRVKGQPWMKEFLKAVINRPDDMLEIYAYYKANVAKTKTMPNQMKDGFAAKLREMDSYQLAKYRGEGREVNLYDLVNLVRPVPTEAINALMKGTLASADTWETAMTKAGQTAETDEQKAEFKRDEWVRLISERKIGYFALLRNLRNIVEQAPEAVDAALEMLVDEKLIKKSLVLPFRFDTAYRELTKPGMQKVLTAIGKAADIALNNVPTFEGRTLVALDVSGSMNGKPAQIGSLFAAALAKASGADVLTFDTKAEWVIIPGSAHLLEAAQKIPFRGGGTNFHLIFESISVAYDRVIVLSDMQGWVVSGYGSSNTFQTSFKQYKTRTGANPHVYSFDLQGYGTLAFPEDKVYLLAGFSDKVFDLMKMLETDRNAMTNTIEAVTF